jgi:uncharacterized protein (DUF433 family)
VEFGESGAKRWWLVPSRKTLVLDPERSFGQPIIAESGLLTARAAEDVKAEGSIEKVARLYELPVRAIRDAVEFESGMRLAKAA